jgi:oxygen-independent coproporphyrinogen-3 oxidase
MSSILIPTPLPLRPAGGRLDAPPPLAVYAHLPWCVRKCPYCDFNSHALRDESVPETAYLDALERDLTAALPLVWGRPVISVFIGGGTPSLFSAAGIERLLTMLRTLLPVAPQAEVTLEANPGTFEAERFRGYREAGVNRLSLGIQSFDPRHLAALGRIHDDRQARAAVETALAIFDNVNLDLMYALPEQTLAEARRDLVTALGYGPQHLSAYHLTLEPNTAFAAAPPPLPDDELAADMQVMVEETLAAASYQHYETSAFARPGRRCQHNLNYWLFGDYLGLGAGAHSKLSFPERILRQSRVRHPRDYLAHAGSAAALGEERELTRADRVFEFMMNALRLTEGYDPRLFGERTGLAPTAAEPGLARAETAGLIQRDLERVRPSERGRRFLNDLLQLFLEGD